MTISPRAGAVQLVLATLAIVAVLFACASAAHAAVNRASFPARAAKATTAKGSKKRVVLRFKVRGLPSRVRKATLVLRAKRAPHATILVRKVDKRRSKAVAKWHPRKPAKKAKRGRKAKRKRTVRIDVTKAVKGNGDVSLALTSRDGRVVAKGAESAKLDVEVAGGDGGRPTAPAPVQVAPVKPAPAPAPAPPPVRSAGVVAGIWASPAELAARPTSGPAWQGVKAAADASSSAKISDQESDHDLHTMAAALVYARTGTPSYRDKAAAGISSAMGTEDGGRTLALGRNLPGYVIAADLIGLGGYDAGLDGRFRGWLAGVRTESLSGDTLVSTHEQRPNNWGTHAGAARVAADAYLGDGADLERAAAVFRGWLGDRGAYAGFKYGDLSYQADPSAPVGVNPAGASKSGVSIDGALPDDMRRGCSFTVKPCFTDYAWEAMQGAVVQAELLFRRGHDAWGWSDRAMLRAATYLQNLNAQFGGWWAEADDTWQPFVLNRAYGGGLPQASSAAIGKNMAFTDWTHGA